MVQTLAIVKTAEADEVKSVNPALPQPLANKGIAEVVDQVVADDVGVTCRDSFAVIGNVLVGGKSGKLRRLGLMIVLQVAADEERLVSVSSNLVVEFEDVGVEAGGIISRKRVARRVQKISAANFGVAATTVMLTICLRSDRQFPRSYRRLFGSR